MKLLALILAFATFAAHADTVVTLNPTTCSYTAPGWGRCADATYALSFHGPDAVLNFAGVTYASDAFSLNGTDMLFVADDGSTVYLSAVITYHAKQINAGRAHYWRHWYTLDAGSVTLPMIAGCTFCPNKPKVVV